VQFVSQRMRQPVASTTDSNFQVIGKKCHITQDLSVGGSAPSVSNTLNPRRRAAMALPLAKNDVSYQGIALAIPQVLPIRRRFRGWGSRAFDFFRKMRSQAGKSAAGYEHIPRFGVGRSHRSPDDEWDA
jgi:hypothetical protein